MIIGCAIMVKNESKRILVTLESVAKHVSCVFVLDTGSTDGTPDIISKFCVENNLEIHIAYSEFVNFEVSRNKLLDFTREFPVDWLLLMDCNDELRGNLSAVFKYIEPNPNVSGLLLRQEWWSGTSTSYYNMRFINNSRKWVYKGVVHEYISQDPKPDEDIYVRIDTDVHIFQDRTLDDDKSLKRFDRDYALLYQSYLNDPSNERTVFYLAQTCACLGKKQESLQYYTIRSTMGGFGEEVFHSLLNMGKLRLEIIMAGEQPVDESIPSCFLKAFEHSKRAEPLMFLCQYYRQRGDFMCAYMFIQMACQLSYPTDCILFVDKRCYDYVRWHEMGIVGYYCNMYESGLNGCLKAISAEDKDIDKNNLQFYTNKLHSINESVHQKVAKPT
jgi:glycosyltransferase involved in cell wall biosynthesis